MFFALSNERGSGRQTALLFYIRCPEQRLALDKLQEDVQRHNSTAKSTRVLSSTYSSYQLADCEEELQWDRGASVADYLLQPAALAVTTLCIVE